jgi:hypothetical protein
MKGAVTMPIPMAAANFKKARRVIVFRSSSDAPKLGTFPLKYPE